MSLGNPKRIGCHVFFCDKPRLTVALATAANANSFALSQSVESQAHVFADHAAICCFHGTGVCRQVTI